MHDETTDELADCPSKTTGKVGQVEQQLAGMSAQVEHQGKLLTELCQRLSKVSREEEDSTCEEKDEETLCPLAQALQMRNKNLTGNNERIEGLISRLEI